MAGQVRKNRGNYDKRSGSSEKEESLVSTDKLYDMKLYFLGIKKERNYENES